MEFSNNSDAQITPAFFVPDVRPIVKLSEEVEAGFLDIREWRNAIFAEIDRRVLTDTQVEFPIPAHLVSQAYDEVYGPGFLSTQLKKDSRWLEHAPLATVVAARSLQGQAGDLDVEKALNAQKSRRTVITKAGKIAALAAGIAAFGRVRTARAGTCGDCGYTQRYYSNCRNPYYSTKCCGGICLFGQSQADSCYYYPLVGNPYGNCALCSGVTCGICGC